MVAVFSQSPLLCSPLFGSPLRGSPLLDPPLLGFPLLDSPLLGFPLLDSPLLCSLLPWHPETYPNAPISPRQSHSTRMEA